MTDKLTTKHRGTKALALLELTHESSVMLNASIYEQENYTTTQDLRREENNYDRKWQPLNITNEEDDATVATYVLMESFHKHIGGVLREGNSSIGMKLNHNIFRNKNKIFLTDVQLKTKLTILKKFYPNYSFIMSLITAVSPHHFFFIVTARF